MKATLIYSNREFLHQLGERKPPADLEAVELVKRYVDSQGKRRVVGNSNLKASQPGTWLS